MEKKQSKFLERFLNLKYEHLFLIFVIPYAFFVLYLTPPFQVPDEQSHFFKSYMVAEGKIFEDRLEKGTGGSLPESLIAAWYYSTNKFSLRFRPHNKVNPEMMNDALSMPLNKSKRIVVDVNRNRSSFVYIPQAIGIKLGLLFDANPIVLLHMGRAFNFMFWLIICFYAIRTSPILKGTLILLLCTPISMSLACSVSRDAVTNCMAFLYIAYILNLSFKTINITKKELIILAILSIATALTKSFYHLCLLTLIIPPSKFKNIKQYIISILGIIFIYYLTVKGLRAFLIYYYNNINTAIFPCTLLPHHLSDNIQINSTNSNVFEFINVFFDTMKYRGSFYMHSFIARLGWLDTFFPNWYINFMFFSIFAVSIFSFEDRKETIFVHYTAKIYFLIFAVLFFIGIHIKIYLNTGNCQYGSFCYLVGIQGRYLIPLSILPFLIFHNNNLTFKKIGRYNKLFISFVLIISISITIIRLSERFYA